MTLLNIHNLEQSFNEISSEQPFRDFFDNVIRNDEKLIYITDSPVDRLRIFDEIVATSIDKTEIQRLYEFLIMSDYERNSLGINYASDKSLHESIDSFASECPTLFLLTQAIRAMNKRIARLELQHEVIFGTTERFYYYVYQLAGNNGAFFSDKVRFGEFLHQLTRRAAGLKPT